MPHKRKSKRAKKLERLYSNLPYEEENPKFSSFQKEVLSTGNLIPRLSNTEVEEINDVICERFNSAQEHTNKISQKMNNWEKQYKGEWQTSHGKEEGDIFLRKTKEQVRVVYSHIIQVINDLNPLVTYRPIVSSVSAASEEFERAKVAEALVDYTLNDLLKFKDDILPQFLKSFLKYSMGVLKLTYRSEASKSDFILENIDRSTLYIDPNAKHDIKNASWVIEKFGLPKREILKRLEDGYWVLPPGKSEEDILALSEYNGTDENYNSAERLFSNAFSGRTTIREDEQAEVWEYWGSPTSGLSDVYSVVVGGEGGMLIRYGSNPYPYKGHPYFAKSYDPHELEVDGEGLVQEMEGIQKITNTMLNLRLKDVRENVFQRVAVTGEYIDADTIEDFQKNRKFVRLSSEALKAAQMDPSFDIRKQFFPLPVNTSTQELYQDLSFYLSQMKENTGVSDAFSGNALAQQVTLGQFQQTLSRSIGVMRPVLLQVASLIEEVADAMLTYFKDPAFFGENRVIHILGSSKYRQTVSNWNKLPDGSEIRDVSPDDVLVDGTMVAVNGFEDQINRQLNLSSAVSMLQAISVNPDMYQDARKRIDFGKLAELMINSSGLKDVESITFSDEEMAKNELIEQQKLQAQEQKQLQLLQLQAQQQASVKEAESQSKAEAQIAVDQAKEFGNANRQMLVDRQRIFNSKDAELEKTKEKQERELASDLARMQREFQLEKQVDRPIGQGNNINQ